MTATTAVITIITIITTTTATATATTATAAATIIAIIHIIHVVTVTVSSKLLHVVGLVQHELLQRSDLTGRPTTIREISEITIEKKRSQ